IFSCEVIMQFLFLQSISFSCEPFDAVTINGMLKITSTCPEPCLQGYFRSRTASRVGVGFPCKGGYDIIMDPERVESKALPFAEHFINELPALEPLLLS
ncbi:MAG TPA: hypothetical protein VKQ08_06390, partial [Cyclobacteriaceae bacterium]|nr:hypothetical protein [Cyclobacteriaceae bacterium]